MSPPSPKKRPGENIQQPDRRVELLTAFAEHLKGITTEITEYKTALAYTYSPDALWQLVRRFQTLSGEYHKYLNIGDSDYHKVITISEGRTEAVKQIISATHALATQLEAYARDPKKFSWSKTQQLLDHVYAPVYNLRMMCLDDARQG